MNGQIEPMIGRYVHVDIGGEMHRIYFEESGAGIPLVCLHTAGSDGRQWRHLLADAEFTEKLPHHRLRHALARQVQLAGEPETATNTSSPPHATRRQSARSARP